MIRLLRRLAILPAPPISSDRAVDLAREECARRGWPFATPLLVAHRLRTYMVVTNASTHGRNARIVVDARTGATVMALYAPR